jgi:DNA-damage-inducible protein D
LSLQDKSNNEFVDSIKHFDENGQEYWIARELMEVLGYKSWQKFKGVTADAIETAQSLVDNVSNHFISTVNMVKRPQGGGVKQVDFKLTRFAAYHIALSCDSRGNEPVKSARNYFVVKTREAEVIIPRQKADIELLKLKMQLEISRNTKYMMDKSESLAIMHGVNFLALILGQPNAVVEVVEKVTETIVCKGNSSVSFEGKSTAQLAKELGFKTGVQLAKWLKQYNLEHLICQGLRAVQAEYIPTENVKAIKDAYDENKSRQRLLGE